MRLLVLIALCFAVASASYANRNRFNRLLRNLQQQQQQQGGYQSQDLYSGEDCDQDDDQQCDDDYQQQCSRNQGYGSLNLQDDEQDYEGGNYYGQVDEDQQDQDDDSEYGQNQNQRRQYQQGGQQYWQQQSGPQQQQKRQQQQRHQCQPKRQLLQALEQPNCKLASKLYQQAKQENDDKNTVVGPAAVQLALAAIQRGCRGQTKRQIQRLIGSQLNQQQQQQAHAALQQSLQGQNQQLRQQSGQNQQAKIKCTTTIVVNQRSQTQQQFIQAVKACLNVQVKKCNFQRQPQQCRQQINQLVAQKTNQKLRQVVPQEAVTENTKLIVVSTAQLKARWGQQFRQQQQTKQGTFYPLGCQQPKPVQVLQSQGQFGYYEDQQLQVVGLPTQRQELTLYVIVPKDKDGLTEIEKQQIQNGQQLKQLLDQADQQQQQIDIELPKFQIKHKIDAKQTLQKQGAHALFDADEADLSGINGQQGQQSRRRQQQQWGDEENDQQNQYDQDDQQQGQGQGQQLHLNKLIHQATIKVDEQGIHAAQPGRHQQQYQQDQYEQDNDQDDDEQQQDQYEQQQLSHQELYEEIFGQSQGGQRQQGRNRRQQRQGQQYQNQGQRKVKVNRAFAFVVKHNPSNQIVLVGRVVDATQKPKDQQQGGRQQGQSLNGVDQQ